MENFTPVSASIGGALIGLSAVLLMGLNGRIAGISGLLSGAFFAERGEQAWRIWFLLGLIGGPIVYANVKQSPVPFDMSAGWPLIIAGGLLVGFGTRLGSGCTSGHGVCGLSRLSVRSMLSVGLFMAFGMITVSIIRHFTGG